MKIKLLIFISAIICIGMTILTVLNNLDYYYAKKLVSAIRLEDMEVIEEILEKRLDCVNTYPQTKGEELFILIMDEYGMDYPLNEACETNNLAIIKTLIEAGADPNCKSHYYTPLSITYIRKRDQWYPISLYLIENGASLNYETEYSGETQVVLNNIVNQKAKNEKDAKETFDAFIYAIERCDHNKVNWDILLNSCVTFERTEIVEYLLDENYCDVNNADSSGKTALMVAAHSSTPEMVQLLLDKGADKDYIDPDGKTAYDYAIECENYEIAEMLSD